MIGRPCYGAEEPVVELPPQEQPKHSGRSDDDADAYPGISGRRRPGCDRSGWDVGDERGEIGMDPAAIPCSWLRLRQGETQSHINGVTVKL